MKLAIVAVAAALAAIAPRVSFAQNDADSGACAPEDERGPCLFLAKGEPCTTSTNRKGACIETSCVTDPNGNAVLMCRPSAEPDAGGCCAGSGNPVTPAIGALGFAIWHRRRRRQVE